MFSISGLAKPGAFTGLQKISPKNYTQWLNGAPLTYTSWDKNNPASPITENCAVF